MTFVCPVYLTCCANSNPLGRIINRFTKDIDNLDLLLPSAMMFFLLSIFYCIQAIVIVAAVVPIVLVPIAGLGTSTPPHPRYMSFST